MCGFRRPVARRTSRLDLDKWPNRMSPLGLGRVKTPTFNLRVEIPSRFRKFENQKCLRPPLREDDRENNSAHSWLVHVFTQPGSIVSVWRSAGHFRSTPINGHSQRPPECLKGASRRRQAIVYDHLTGPAPWARQLVHHKPAFRIRDPTACADAVISSCKSMMALVMHEE